MMVRWSVTADKKTADILDQLRKLPLDQRRKNPLVKQFVTDMYKSWSTGTKIERLAILGWREHDSIELFCNLLDNLPQLRKEYIGQMLLHGKPPELKDEDLERYESESNKQRKLAERKFNK